MASAKPCNYILFNTHENMIGTNNQTLKGGEWLVKDANPEDIFIPEEFSEEQKMIKDMACQFISNEVLPYREQIENQEEGLTPKLLKQAGQLGLLGTSLPEKYGGLEKDLVTSTLIADCAGPSASFCVSFIAHTGIGTLPILYFGNEEQKEKYLPKLASGEWIGAYGLTEPGSGTDALGAKTTAVLSEDGQYYILNGQKCWISNGGFADIFTVFAKIDGDKFSAFIVEKGTEGFTIGEEEHKMGIKGSSTTQLYFQDCKVPVENLLGEIGRGHIIAFNTLNTGRYKLGASTLGGARSALNLSLEYAKTREQFNTPIINFGAIKYKIATMAIKIWVGESALYRTGKMIDDREAQLISKGETFENAYLQAAEEYAIESAILKVFGSETLDYVVDEGVQIHGGNGFSDEYIISKAYRDSRINRIYEGTNEINRLLAVDMVLKRAMKGKIDLMTPAMAVSKELLAIPDFNTQDDENFGRERRYIKNFKKAVLMVAGAAVQKYMMNLDKQQEIIMNIANMAMDVYLAESALLRLIKIADTYGSKYASIQNDIVSTFLYDAADRIYIEGKTAVNSFAEGDELRMMMMGLKRYTKVDPFNTKDARRRIVDRLEQDNRYKL